MRKVLKKLKRFRMSWLILVLISFLFGCSAESGPINLPIPFSGALTADTNIYIAEGSPIESSSLQTLSKAQTQGEIRWQIRDPLSGITVGTATILSMSEPSITPSANGGVRRTYTLHLCLTRDQSIDDCAGFEVCSENFQCFEDPTDYPPSAEVIDFASSIGGTATVRKALCSGNIDADRGAGDFTPGELLDGKLLIGTAELPGNEFVFHTMEESAFPVHGVSFCSTSGDPDGATLLTIATQGLGNPIPDGVNVALQNLGDPTPAGIVIYTEPNFTITQGGAMLVLRSNLEFILGEDHLIARNARTVLDRISDVTDIQKNVIRDLTATDDPAQIEMIETFLAGAESYYSTVVGESDPIPCSDTTGIFLDACNKSPSGFLDLHFRCAPMVNLGDPHQFFTIEGVWVFTSSGE